MSILTLNLESYIGNQYLLALALLIIWGLVFRLALTIVERTFIKLASKTKTDLDDIILARLSRPLTILSFLAAIVISISSITFSPLVEPSINSVIHTLLSIVVGYSIFVVLDLILIRAWKKFSEKTESDLDDTLMDLVHSVLKGAFLVIIALYILNVWGVEIGPLLAGLGIAGLAVALALQPTLSNIFSGVALILDQTFKQGDVIKTDSGDLGTVHKIGIRTTKITTFDNEMIIVPNSVLANSKIQNFFQPDKRIRVNIEFGVEYGADPEYVKKIVIEEIEKIEILDKEEPVRILFTNMGDSSINFKAMFWVDDIGKKWPAHQEAITRVYRRLYEEGLEIPYPQSTIWMRDEGKAKSKNPSDPKFKSTKGKYLSDFGHEFKEEKKEDKEQTKTKKKSGFLGRLNKFKRKK
tara:strand:+ start:1440 stop:2669 length:1230 start_codon:yes stop_codon:yes gene_type:complete